MCVCVCLHLYLFIFCWFCFESSVVTWNLFCLPKREKVLRDWKTRDGFQHLNIQRWVSSCDLPAVVSCSLHHQHLSAVQSVLSHLMQYMKHLSQSCVYCVASIAYSNREVLTSVVVGNGLERGGHRDVLLLRQSALLRGDQQADRWARIYPPASEWRLALPWV